MDYNVVDEWFQKVPKSYVNCAHKGSNLCRIECFRINGKSYPIFLDVLLHAFDHLALLHCLNETRYRFSHDPHNLSHQSLSNAISLACGTHNGACPRLLVEEMSLIIERLLVGVIHLALLNCENE